jgi:hypothetical protein
VLLDGNQDPMERKIRKKKVMDICEAIRSYYADAVADRYDWKLKRASMLEVELYTNELIGDDDNLVGQMMALVHREALSLTRIITPREIRNEHARKMRDWLREQRVDTQLSLFDDATLGVMMSDGFLASHGQRVFAVPGSEKEMHKPRARWEWLRYVEHGKPSDLRAGISTKNAIVNVQRDSLRLDEILLNIMRRLNPEGYENDLEMGLLFQSQGGTKDDSE